LREGFAYPNKKQKNTQYKNGQFTVAFRATLAAAIKNGAPFAERRLS
jgi:hypothetical protein